MPSAPERTTGAAGAIRTGRTRRAVVGVTGSSPGRGHRFGTAALVQLAERRAFAHEALEQRCRLPAWSELAVESGDAIEDGRQADAIGIEHRPAAPGGEAVAAGVDDVDVG